MQKMKLLLACLTLFVGFEAVGLDLTLHLYKDTLTINNQLVTMAVFTDQEEFTTKNRNIHLEVNEVLNLTVVNHDSLEHSLTIDGVLESENLIAGSSSGIFELTFTEAGSHRYYSSPYYGGGLGASGIILVGYNEVPAYFWNLFELENELTHDIAALDVTQLPMDFKPEFFMINGAMYPNTLDDEEAYVTEGLGTEIIISIVNSGHMDHALHFHGYHVEILDARITNSRVGWIKDSLPLKVGEAMTVRLQANLLGTYPVHDHNLIAVTNAGFYPGGMITQINITE